MGGFMPRKERHIRQTKDRVIAAMFKLLTQKNFDAITVGDLLEEAELSRRTFYRYFDNKDAILKDYFDYFIARYVALKKETPTNETLEDRIVTSLDFFLKHREDLRLLIFNQKFHLLLLSFNKSTDQIYNTLHITSRENKNELQRDIGQLIIGGYFNIVCNWLMEENPRPSRAVASNLMSFFSQLNEVEKF